MEVIPVLTFPLHILPKNKWKRKQKQKQQTTISGACEYTQKLSLTLPPLEKIIMPCRTLYHWIARDGADHC